MKTKICLLGIFALVPLAIAAPHTWILSMGKTVAGDYVSSGTTTLVVKTGGTNCFLAISNLSTNDLAYVAKIKADQKQARQDAEVKQMLSQPGWMEITASLLDHFPEKVDNHPGWMDADFQNLENIYVESKADQLGFWIRDKNGDSFSRCIVHKTDLNGNPDPLVSQILNLKSGDKVRFIGVVMTGGDNLNRFHISKIEMIETAAEKKAREQTAESP
jgi:hypothetical protein